MSSDDKSVGGSASGVGSEFRQFRQQAGLSQAELATLLSTSQADVSAWEQGQSVPPKEIIETLRSLPVAVSGDVTVGGNIKIGDVIGGSAIVTGDSNEVVISYPGTKGLTVHKIEHVVTGDFTTTGRGFSIGGDIVGRDKITTDHPKEVLSSEQALGRISDAVRLNLGQLQLNMEQARRESSQFFRTTMIFSGFAFAIILSGIGLMLGNLVTVGIVTTAASIIPQAGALLLFNKDKELRKTIETYHGHILESQRILTMIDLSETIHEAEAKDSVKEQIVFAVLKVSPAPLAERRARTTSREPSTKKSGA